MLLKPKPKSGDQIARISRFYKRGLNRVPEKGKDLGGVYCTICTSVVLFTRTGELAAMG